MAGLTLHSQERSTWRERQERSSQLSHGTSWVPRIMDGHFTHSKYFLLRAQHDREATLVPYQAGVFALPIYTVFASFCPYQLLSLFVNITICISDVCKPLAGFAKLTHSQSQGLWECNFRSACRRWAQQQAGVQPAAEPARCREAQSAARAPTQTLAGGPPHALGGPGLEPH